MNLAETIYKDASTMERLVKIVEGIWDGRVTFELDRNEASYDTVCCIGDWWFYFLPPEDDGVSPEAIKAKYGIFELAQMILDAIVDLDEDEYNYYCACLNFA